MKTFIKTFMTVILAVTSLGAQADSVTFIFHNGFQQPLTVNTFSGNMQQMTPPLTTIGAASNVQLFASGGTYCTVTFFKPNNAPPAIVVYKDAQVQIAKCPGCTVTPQNSNTFYISIN